MTMHIRLTFFMMTVCCSLLLMSCSKDEASDNDYKETKISFSPTNLGKGIGDSGTRAETTTKENLDYFNVSCSIYPANDTYTNNAWGSFFRDVKIDASTGECDYFWPGKKYNLSFFAYYPCNNDVYISSATTEKGSPTYYVSDGYDFVTADVLDHIGTSTTAVPLTFAHHCTDIRFTCYNQSDLSITVNSVAIGGVYNSGWYHNGSWTTDDSVDKENRTVTRTVALASEASTDYTGTDKHLILIPQTIATGTTFITAKTTEQGEEKTYNYVLPEDLTLLAGKSYNFNLTLSYGQLIVDVESDIKDWEGDVVYLKPTGDTTDFSSSAIDNDNLNGNIKDWTNE